MFGNFGSVSSQFFRGAPAPPSSITVNSISTTSGSNLITTYTTSGASQRNQLPVATNVQLTGLKNVGETVNSSYTYFHINNSTEGATEINIQRADDSGFTTNVQTIATSTPYILQVSDEDKYVRLGVTPKTSDGTTGTISYSSVSQVGAELTQRQIWISFGPAAKSFSGTNWNLAHTDNPDGTYSLNNLVNSIGTVLTGVNINVDLAMSDSNTGSANAGTGPAANFPAGSASGFWYPASGSRGFIIELPTGGLGIGIGEIEILSNTTSGTTNEAILGVNGNNNTLPNVTGSTVDDVSLFENVDMSSDITIRSTDSTGLSPINAMIIYYYE